MGYDDLPPTLPDAEHTYMMGNVQYYMKLQVARKEIDDMSAKQMKIASKMEEVKSRWAYVLEKLTNFKEIMLQCNDYILSNDQKRWHAESIYKEQHKVVVEKVAEILKLSRTVAALSAHRDRKKLASLKCVALQAKIEESLFRSLGLRTMDSILKRNESLNATLIELREKMEEPAKELQSLRAERSKMHSTHHMSCLRLGVISADLFYRLMGITNEVFYFNGLIDSFMLRATHQDIEIGHLRYSTFTLYRTICEFQGREMHTGTGDTKAQLPYICNFMWTYQHILRDVQREMELRS